MEYKNLGNTNIKISRFILGAWQFGMKGWGEVSEKEINEVIELAIANGVTTIDTAWIYGRGKSEEIIGKVIKKNREKIIIATKCLPKVDKIESQLQDSLRRLQTDYIDLYQVHWLENSSQVKPIIEKLCEFKEKKYINAIGISNFSLSEHKEALKYAEIASTQMPYSMLETDIEKDIIPFCLEHNISILAYSPLQKGLLTGKYTGRETFPKDDVRSWDRNFIGKQFTKNVEFVNRLKPIAEKYGKTVAQLALNWTISKKQSCVGGAREITAIIVGAKTKKQLLENLEIFDWEISTEDIEKINLMIKEHKNTN